jgi:anaphase-promoting complex subunit 8
LLRHHPQVENATIPLLHAELSQAHQLNKLDGFNLYLYGVVLKSMQRTTEAREVLCKAVCEYPLNWSAWLDLAALCETKQVVDGLTLPQHWVVPFFRAHMYLELQLNADAGVLYAHLLDIFPTSPYVLGQRAVAEYNQRNFDQAQETFKEVQAIDPFRLQNMDTYSNILYVKESKAELSFLAHSAVRSNKFRPETCCIVGNYYSLKAQHESAVQYFKRALRLNRRYLSAWTLMGHEYVEMKNTPAAIEAYRSAVNINPRDYRAWYGLGQTYEILQM